MTNIISNMWQIMRKDDINGCYSIFYDNRNEEQAVPIWLYIVKNKFPFEAEKA